MATLLGLTHGVNQGLRQVSAWTSTVCKIMALMAVITGLGLFLFTYFRGCNYERAA